MMILFFARGFGEHPNPLSFSTKENGRISSTVDLDLPQLTKIR